VLGASAVQNPAAYDGGTYAVQFHGRQTYEVRDSANVLVTSGTYISGQSIAFRGVQVTLSGQPPRRFVHGRREHQSKHIQTVQNLVTALQTGTGTSATQAKLNNFAGQRDQQYRSSARSDSNVRATIGARLNTITTQQSSQHQQIQLKAPSPRCRAWTTPCDHGVDLQNTTLSASMQAYTLTQGLTLFKYL